MKVAVYSTKPYDQAFLQRANKTHRHALSYFDVRLISATAPLARGHQAVCAFVNDDLGRDTLEVLSDEGVRIVALRAAGFNNVDLAAAAEQDMTVARVPSYSPHAVAEHALALILTLNRKLYRAYNRVREGNFSLDGLLGFDLCGKTVGVIGTGKIGTVFARIMAGLGCRVLAYDPAPNPDVDKLASYVPLEELFLASDIVSLHCPLTPDTYHVINDDALARMKRGVMLINTSRGRVVDTQAIIRGLKQGKSGISDSTFTKKKPIYSLRIYPAG
ncbi:2-hydroxyacid dehydrogenase [Alkalilimnicola ehrlichii]|uniref:2-hydroxyacid dehydrogenase n=1 Tax=Alkalilimnicola ehrlichii TaxID=351052 RepID=UPI00268AC2DF|nr:2-hydroxyacid dehydrogenase [Alkalilimnicola ehrlichii]